MPIAQAAGTAVLLQNDTRSAGRACADGVHVDADSGKPGRRSGKLSPQRHRRVGDIRSRHDAMRVAEMGADYVFFGLIERSEDAEVHPKTLQFADWWSELFETLCVALCGSAFSGIGTCAATGADFVGRGAIWNHPDGSGRGRDRGKRHSGAIHARQFGRRMTTRATPGIHALTVAATLAAVLSAAGMALAQSGEPSPAAEVSPPQMAPLEGEPATGSAANPLTGTATRLEALADDQEPLPSPVGTRPPLPLPVAGETIDYAYGAFQRGWYLTALSLATPRAEEGDTAAQTLLGVLYETGRGLPQDAEKAASWYSLAAANGNVKAALRYGLLLLNGIGVAEDRQKAGDMFQIAADADVPEAIYNLAGLYRTGEGRPYDPDTALELLQKAAELDDVDAQFELAQFRLDGPADVRDEARAAFWMGRAARQGMSARRCATASCASTDAASTRMNRRPPTGSNAPPPRAIPSP
ncbi:MAG: SEL1-like repeat protein [Alphaproteobacteria bacterium]|nr:SEL1-like repeat protein [Alphaproteobacteria bacterium]